MIERRQVTVGTAYISGDAPLPTYTRTLGLGLRTQPSVRNSTGPRIAANVRNATSARYVLPYEPYELVFIVGSPIRVIAVELDSEISVWSYHFVRVLVTSGRTQ